MNKRFKQIIKCWKMQKNYIYYNLGFLKRDGQFSKIVLVPSGKEDFYKLLYGDELEIW